MKLNAWSSQADAHDHWLFIEIDLCGNAEASIYDTDGELVATTSLDKFEISNLADYLEDNRTAI
jgi:hypothetical protein